MQEKDPSQRSSQSMESSKTHIVLVSIPAISHQVSILEFAKRFVDLHKEYSFHVTCIIPTIDKTTTTITTPNSIFFDSLPPCIQCIFLDPVVNFEDLRNEATLESQLYLTVTRSMPLVRQTLISLSNVVALIADLGASEALHFAKEFNILCYIYFPCSAMALSLCLYPSKLDQVVSSEYRDQHKLIQIPGCIPVEETDLMDSVQNKSSLAYKVFLHRVQQFRLADGGIIVNSFKELEGGAMRAIFKGEEKEESPITVYPIGPVIQTRPNSEKKDWECLQWLDNQQTNSVLYISFGSGGTLSQEQINELALGLELSNQKFLWVNVKVPNNKAAASYLSNDEGDPIHFLPSGFLQRSKGQGFVMSGWAPQVEILKHIAISAFLTHCGWNSILESIVYGVPMIAWPLFSEQRMNAALVTNGLKVAMRPKCNSEGVVIKEEIGDLVKGIMEGLESDGIRLRMKELQRLAACTMMEDGSSTKTLSELALKWYSLGKPME